MKDNGVLHTLYADGAQPGVIHLDHDTGPIIDEIIAKTKKDKIESWETQGRMMYSQRADEFVDFILERMPGGLVDAIFAKLAAYKSGLFVIPHVSKPEIYPVEEINGLFDVLSGTCRHREQTDCRHPQQDFNAMLCDISNCPLLGATKALIELPSGQVARAFAAMAERCVDRDGLECLHPKQDFPHGICASLHCPRINGKDECVERMTNPTAPGGQQS